MGSNAPPTADKKAMFLSKARMIVLPADVRSQESFITACLAWSEFSRVGFYRKMRALTKENVPLNLPRFNRVELVNTDQLEVRVGDVVEATCWYAKDTAGRSFETHSELYLNGRFFCKVELVRAFIEKGKSPEKEALKQALLEEFGQYFLPQIDMNAKMAEENVVVKEVNVCLSDLDALDHVNMAMYAQLFLNVMPKDVLDGWTIKRCDIDYIREVPRNAKVQLSLNTTVDGAFMLYIRDTTGKILNRMRVETERNGKSCVRVVSSVRQALLLSPVRYEQSCISATFATWLMEYYSFCLLQHPSKPGLGLDSVLARGVHFDIKSCPNYSAVVAARFREDVTLDVWNMDSDGPVYSTQAGKTIAIGRVASEGRNGNYFPEYRIEYMTQNGKFYLPRLLSLMANAKDKVLPAKSKSGNHDKPYAERLMTYKTDLWYDEISVQIFPEYRLLDQWSQKPSSLVVQCSEHERGVSVFNCLFEEKMVAQLITKDAKPDSAVLTFFPFTMSTPKYNNHNARAIEGQLEKKEEQVLYSTFWAPTGKI